MNGGRRGGGAADPVLKDTVTTTVYKLQQPMLSSLLLAATTIPHNHVRSGKYSNRLTLHLCCNYKYVNYTVLYKIIIVFNGFQFNHLTKLKSMYYFKIVVIIINCSWLLEIQKDKAIYYINHLRNLISRFLSITIPIFETSIFLAQHLSYSCS